MDKAIYNIFEYYYDVGHFLNSFYRIFTILVGKKFYSLKYLANFGTKPGDVFFIQAVAGGGTLDSTANKPSLA